MRWVVVQVGFNNLKARECWMTQDNVTYVIAAGVASEAATGWTSLIPDQNLQNVMYELTILWLLLQIAIKCSNWYKGKSGD
jgi:hypothetical protein